MGNKNSGPRPKPTALKLLRGERTDRLNPAEPKPPPGPVEMPAGLSPGAQRVWAGIAPVCLMMGTLTPADVTVFARMCELEATWRAIVAKKGTSRFKPQLELVYAKGILNYADKFGLDPISRARIQLPPTAPVSKWAAR